MLLRSLPILPSEGSQFTARRSTIPVKPARPRHRGCMTESAAGHVECAAVAALWMAAGLGWDVSARRSGACGGHRTLTFSHLLAADPKRCSRPALQNGPADSVTHPVES